MPSSYQSSNIIFTAQTMKTIILNADLGEGCGFDQQILPFINAANIACGGHAGNQQTMLSTITAAIAHDVDIGAHPSYPDQQNFGRQTIALSRDALYASITSQLSALQSIAKQQHVSIQHIKPHGALYNDAAVDNRIANTFIDACINFDPKITLVGLANGELVKIAKARGLPYLAEGFIDRRYLRNGLLVPRDQPNAVINNLDEACQQALQIVSQQTVTTHCHAQIELDIHTLCLHGDNPQAVALAARVAQLFKKNRNPNKLF